MCLIDKLVTLKGSPNGLNTMKGGDQFHVSWNYTNSNVDLFKMEIYELFQ